MIKPFETEYFEIAKFKEFIDFNIDNNFTTSCGISQKTKKSAGYFFLFLITFIIAVSLVFLYF